MYENISPDEMKKLLFRQQEDLQNLTVIKDEYVSTIKKQDAEITRLLRLLEEREEQVRKLNEVVQQMHNERATEYRADASKRGERIE